MALGGLTPAAGKLLGEMANEYRQLKPELGRRTRRVWPTGGAKLILMQYVSLDDFLGPTDATGVQIEGEAEIVDSLITGMGANDGTNYDVKATYLGTIIHPNAFFWARRGADGIYYAVAGGVSVVSGTMTGATTLAATSINATGGMINVTLTVTCGNETYVQGQVVFAIFAYVNSAWGFHPFMSCCPPGGT